jgi:divalent metal cation (Fe/Co/Zn/Cd) transporter
MPLLAWRKRVTAKLLDSRSMLGDSRQALLCASLSAVLLVGLAANALWGWWWADPIAAIGIAALAAREGYEMWTSEDICC